MLEQSWQQADKPHRRCYQYNDGNQLVGIQDSEQGTSEYQFDPLDQLSLSRLPTGEDAFSFDSFGNPEGEDTEVSDDRLLSFQGNRYSYDKFGNQVRMQSPAGYQQRKYNGLNQLTSVKSGGRYTQYQYDALGRRSAKITEGGRTDYLWDGEQLIGEHCNGEYTWYLYEPGTFKPVALIKQGQIYHYHLDHLGTPLKLTDISGTVVWDAQYQTYGAVTLDVETISNPLRFQGQYFDEETGLHYNRFRYYDPDSGRFIHQDPIGLLGGLNHYQYAPNPVQWIDPLGLSCKEGMTFTNAAELVGGTIQGVIGPIKQATEYAIANPEQAMDALFSGIYDGLYAVADAIYYPIDYGLLEPADHWFGTSYSTGSRARMDYRVNQAAEEFAGDYSQFQHHWDNGNFVLAGNIIGSYAGAINPSKKAFTNLDLKPDLADLGKKLDLNNRKTPDDFDYKGLNHRKAAAGEFNAHALMEEKGFTPLGNTDGVYRPGINGIDGVYRHPNPPPDFVITEAKYNKARLGKTKDGKQMNNRWVTKKRLQDAGLSRKEIRKIKNGLNLGDGTVEKYLIRNKPNGTLVVKRLDKDAHVVGKALDLDSELGL